MSIIHQLDSQVANMIAAGEVVLGPESVVKELVENAIDAKATLIEINLVDSGLKQIEVCDNGIGMDKTDATLCFSRHATSKIKNAFDLGSIKSLGFRGEALPSIASVSNLEMWTKRKDDEVGTKVTLQAGKLKDVSICSANNGTRIVVSNLFYNTPARLKYLKGPSVILAKVSSLVDKFVLANPHVGFTFRNNDNILLQTSPNANYQNIFNAIYGLDIAKNMHYQEYGYDGINLKLYYSNPVVNRSRKDDITVIVNGRFVKSNLITNAICLAYENYIPKYRYPVLLYILDIDSLLIDINVHPQKTEIKFSNEDLITKLTYDSVLDALHHISVYKEVEQKEKDFEPINFDEYLHEDKNVTYEPKKIDKPQFASPRVIYNENQNKDLDNVEDVEEKVIEEHKEVTFEQQVPKHLPYLEYIGQLAGTYLLFQNDEGMYLIDQHAAQERINYEYYKNILANPNTDNIDLLVPYSIHLKNSDYIILKANLDKLMQYGLYLDDMGNNTFFVRKTPLWIKENYEEVIEKTLYFLIEKNTFDLSLIRDSLAKMIACKASIKANTFITSEGAYNLINQLDKCDNPFNCPHGRPIFVKLTLKEIEKLFLRTL